MSDGDSWPWILSVLLLFFADYIAVTETALASVSKVRMKTLADHGNAGAQKVLDALEHFDRTISTILICTNISHLAIASLVTVAVTRRWGLSAVSVATILTSLVVMFFGEMLPKSIAKKYSERFSLLCIRPLTFLTLIFRPFSAILSAIGNAAAKLTKGDPEISVTEDELYDIIDDMTEEGSLDEDQGDLISSALQFGSVTVESILTPRVDVVGIDVSLSPDAVMELIREQNHSRLPVYEGSIDHVIGVLRIRNFIKVYLRRNGKLNIRRILDKPVFVTESTTVDDLLTMMTRSRANLAVVTDHYGGTVGIVTVEDILETLVGEIWDEDDEVKEAIVKEDEGKYLVDAEEPLGDVLEEIGFELKEDVKDEELINTLVGEWVYDHFPGVPAVGDSFVEEGEEQMALVTTVREMDGNRILHVELKLEKMEEKEEEEAAS